MATIVTRAGKGSPLTHNEVDANFTNLNTDKAELASPALTGNVTVASNSAVAAVTITQIGAGNALVVEDSANPDTTPFVVTATGSVGIGTSSPLAKVHSQVNTFTTADMVAYKAYNAQGVGVYANFQNSTTGTTITDGFLIGINDSEEAVLINYEATAMAFFTSATERMRIDASGNVGIGTSSPSTYGNLAIFGKTYSSTGYALTSDSSNFTPSGVTNSIPNYGLGAPEVSVVSLSGFESLRFYANQIERLRVAQLGQIGIGGANYGKSGQVLTSGGSGASPSWTSSALGSTVVSSKIGSRATATTYQNTTSGWLLVSVSMSNNGQTFLLGSTSGLGITGISMNVAASNMTYLVPPSWYYRVTGTVISVWTEGQA
jgi:hypothetical protein